jgi:hypothetical protein
MQLELNTNFNVRVLRENGDHRFSSASNLIPECQPGVGGNESLSHRQSESETIAVFIQCHTGNQYNCSWNHGGAESKL